MIEYENLRKVNEPYFSKFRQVFDNVLESGWFILGSQVEEFEKEFASWNNVEHCVGVASGLDALTLSLKALNMPDKSEVIVPSNTYIASILGVIHSGHIPVLVEPDINTYNIDPARIESAITAKTRAILIVHLYGKPCDIDPIMDICRRKNLYMVEDCAQAHGAICNGKKTGCFGNISAFSFYPTKNLGCLGDGGAIVTNDPDLVKRSRMLRNYGSEKKYVNEYAGFNSRLDELQAAFLRVKLKDLDRINNHKKTLASEYHKGIKGNFILPVISKNTGDVYHIFNIRHPKRDDLQSYLQKNGIKTEIHYPVPPHRQKALAGYFSGEFPLSSEIHDTTLSLPISVCHSVDEIKSVIEILNCFNP